MNAIVFSKDRAGQLDLFIRSFEQHVKCGNMNLKVLYTYSNQEFMEGYDKVKAKFPGIHFKREFDFKPDLLSLVEDSEKHIVFFVDDNIFLHDFSTEDKEFKHFSGRGDILCLSLRCHPNLTYCYPASVEMTNPNMNGDNVWNWINATGDYGYPMSLDGHVFRTSQIKQMLLAFNYKNPNSLEFVLSMNPMNLPKMSCYDKAIIVNNPCNKVQTNNPNKHGDIDAKVINDMFLDDYYIDLSPYTGNVYESCHKELPVSFVKSEY